MSWTGHTTKLKSKTIKKRILSNLEDATIISFDKVEGEYLRFWAEEPCEDSLWDNNKRYRINFCVLKNIAIYDEILVKERWLRYRDVKALIVNDLDTMKIEKITFKR